MANDVRDTADGAASATAPDVRETQPARTDGEVKTSTSYELPPWQGPGAPDRRHGLFRRIVRWPGADMDRIDDERFAAAIDRFQLQMSSLAADRVGAQAVQQARDYIGIAQQRWELGQREAAWTAYKSAERCLVELMDEHDLVIEQQRVLQEAREKLSGWRKATVEGLLAARLDESDAATDVSRPALVRRLQAARRIIDDSDDNTYLRMRLLRGHLRRAGAVLIIVLLFVWGTVVAAQAAGWSPGRNQDPFTSGWQFAVLVGLGAFGAAVSGVVRFMSTETIWRIPQLKAERVLIWLRPIVGAAAAIVVIGVLASGLGGLQLGAEAALAIALISGFSETLVSRAVTQASSAIAGR